jgi:hypothetical protein
MRTNRFGRKLKLPATIALKHQIRKLMFDDLSRDAEAAASALRPASDALPILAPVEAMIA